MIWTWINISFIFIWWVQYNPKNLSFLVHLVPTVLILLSKRHSDQCYILLMVKLLSLDMCLYSIEISKSTDLGVGILPLLLVMFILCFSFFFFLSFFSHMLSWRPQFPLSLSFSLPRSSVATCHINRHLIHTGFLNPQSIVKWKFSARRMLRHS